MNKGNRSHKYLFLLTICILVVSLLLPGCRKQTIEELIDDLDHSNVEVQERAVQALVEIGTPAIEPLILALSSDTNPLDINPFTAPNAADALAQIGTPAAEALIAHLNDEDVQIRAFASYSLTEIGVPAVEALVVALVDKDSDIRDIARLILLNIGTSVTEPLIAALDNNTFLTQFSIAEVLADIPTTDARRAAEQYFAPAKLLQTGQGIKETADYSGPGPHPIMILYSSDTRIHPLMYELPSEWVPTSVDDIQLGAFVGEDEWVTIETCSYTGGGRAYRKQHKIDVSLMETQTGSVVASNIFFGSLPPPCPAVSFFMGDTDVKTHLGNEVPFTEIQQWLTGYVEN